MEPQPDTPTPPEASGETSFPPLLAPEAAAPARRQRRVDWLPKLRWFGAEYLIVVLGVLTAVALNAWWQGQQDAAHEQDYLHQLLADLNQTEEHFERMGPWHGIRDVSAAKLVRSFRSGSTPPADSVVHWAWRASQVDRSTFVTGTATALVETGDLNLIRDDSLRSSITQYIDLIGEEKASMAHNDEDMSPYIATLSARVDFGDAEIARRSPAELDSLARARPFFPIPEAPQRAFTALDVEALFRDREAYTAMWNIWRLRDAMVGNRRRALRVTVALREQIEAALDR